MSEAVTVRILDRDYLIACEPEERNDLVAAASYLDGKLRELRENNRGGGLERVAVLAALNITHELLGLKQQQAASSDHLAQHLQALKSKLEAGLPTSLQ
jgi:cell division protein ZapA